MNLLASLACLAMAFAAGGDRRVVARTPGNDMINAIACPHCKRAISYDRSDLYTPERSLRIECATCKKPVLLLMTAEGDVTAKPA
jgi:hypothetical protein